MELFLRNGEVGFLGWLKNSIRNKLCPRWGPRVHFCSRITVVLIKFIFVGNKWARNVHKTFPFWKDVPKYWFLNLICWRCHTKIKKSECTTNLLFGATMANEKIKMTHSTFIGECVRESQTSMRQRIKGSRRFQLCVFYKPIRESRDGRYDLSFISHSFLDRMVAHNGSFIKGRRMYSYVIAT